ncbi:hypothetical protein C0J52_11032 [Blattella germanica]|nr:hypothetical protein C0J52_11032 [Blattella germanica]
MRKLLDKEHYTAEQQVLIEKTHSLPEWLHPKYNNYEDKPFNLDKPPPEEQELMFVEDSSISVTALDFRPFVLLLDVELFVPIADEVEGVLDGTHGFVLIRFLWRGDANLARPPALSKIVINLMTSMVLEVPFKAEFRTRLLSYHYNERLNTVSKGSAQRCLPPNVTNILAFKISERTHKAPLGLSVMHPKIHGLITDQIQEIVPTLDGSTTGVQNSRNFYGAPFVYIFVVSFHFYSASSLHISLQILRAREVVAIIQLSARVPPFSGLPWLYQAHCGYGWSNLGRKIISKSEEKIERRLN